MKRAQVVLITGASMGIGRAIAAHLAHEGHQVFGTSRQPQTETLDGFRLLALDVTSDESAAACVATVIACAGRIDVLVNNAGVDLVGGLEETTLEDARWIFDTNFFGVHRMIQAVLPHMRAQRSGQIINISSALGRAAWPFEALYCASKFALEGYTEALRYEMNLFNIRVSSIQPGFFKSNMIKNQGYASGRIADYDLPRQQAITIGKQWADTAPDPAPVARKVAQIIQLRRPRVRYPVGWEAVIAPPLAHLMPGRVLFKLGRWMLRVDDWRADIARWGKHAGIIGGLAALILLLRRRR